MGKLTQVTLVTILNSMIQDENFAESLADCIGTMFDITPPNSKPNHSLGILADRIMEYYEVRTEMREIEIPGLRGELIAMLKEQHFLAFARILRMFQDLFKHSDARVINYLKQLKLKTDIKGGSVSPWIDVRSTANAIIQELNPERMKIFVELSREEKCLLQGFTTEQIAVMSKFSPRGIATLSKHDHSPPSISDLTVEDRENYLNLSPRELDTLNNLNDDHRNVVLGFRNLKEVLNVAKNLHSSQRDLILSLRQGEIDALLDDFYQIRMIASRSPEIIQNSSPITVQEQYAILELNQHQRLVLANAYNLGHDGLFMIRQLGPEQTNQVLNGIKESTVMQTALKNKLANVDFDKNILSELFEIMEHKSRAVLLNLSWKGIKLLRKTADLDEGMTDIVRRLSNNGLEVLIQNDQLNVREISMLGSLDPSVGNLLMNLNLNQRHRLSHRPDIAELPSGLFQPNQLTRIRSLDDKAESVLKQIVLLTDAEEQLVEALEQVNTTVLTNMDPIKLNLFATLSLEQINLLSTFMIWHFEEDLVFKILNGDEIERIGQVLERIPRIGSIVAQHSYVPLIAGAIEVLRLNGVITNRKIEEIEDRIHTNTLSLLFKVNLLKFSVRDTTSLVPPLSFKIEGTEAEIMTIGRFNQIRTIDDLMFVRWILSSSATMNDRELFQVGRGSLIQLSYYLHDGHKLKALLSESASQLDGIDHKTLMWNFKRMMRADRYSLATCFFFALGRESSSDEAVIQMTKIFMDNFDADECFEFLNTPSNNGFLHGLRDRGLPDILSDGRFQNPSILEVCLYYNRGNVLALSERLDKGQLWKLAKNRPLLLLRMMTRNVQLDLIKLFGKVEEFELVLNENRVGIVEDLMEELKQRASILTPDMYSHVARGIRSLHLQTETYITFVSEYIKIVQRRMSGSSLRTLLDSFVTDNISREYLITAVENQLGNELVVSLRDKVRISCDVMRKKRSTLLMCLDSEGTKDMTYKGKQRIVQSKFDDVESTLYEELLEYSKRKFSGREIDTQIQRDLISRMKNIPPGSLDPRLGDVVATLDNPQEFDTILKQSGTLVKIEEVASTTGLALTMFLVGKHMARGDVENLGYDALNLWVMPKIGEQLTRVLEKSNPVIGPVFGATLANFAAFLGLVEGVRARENASDENEKEMANLNIVTNTVFVAANIPAVATRTLANLEVDIGVVGEFTGPIGASLTVSVIVGSYLRGVSLEVERLTKNLNLSVRKEIGLYWDFLWDQPVPENLKIDIGAGNMYSEYITGHLRRLNGRYDKIAVSVPSFFITEEDENVSYRMDFSRGVEARYPFARIRQNSRLFPKKLEGYGLVCGPSAGNAEQRIVSSHTKELFIPTEPDDDCRNIVSFRKHRSSNSSKTFLYVASDATIELSDDDHLDVVFYGKNLILGDLLGNSSVNTYHFQEHLDTCRVRKKGHNLFYVVGRRFECDLGDEDQFNTVVIRGDFVDSTGIDSIVGSERQERIEVNFAEFVDGNGGGDVIRATRNTVVKGYVNDFITGDCTVMIPFDVSEIAKIVANTRLSIQNREGSWIEVDGNARIMTADHYLLTTIRTTNDTRRTIRAHIRKSFEDRIFIEDELPVLRNLTIPNCRLVKQITSANYDIVLSESGKTVFRLDKNTHWYYWEAVEDPGNLYIFRKFFANVIISNANGILDFRELKTDPTFDRVKYNLISGGGFEVSVGGLQVNLLSNYRNVTMTFDGRKYFKVEKTGICRDWCSHSLPIVGRVVIDGTDLQNHYNCFEFRSCKVLFLRLGNDLVLVSSKEILTIGKYYSHLREESELSLKTRDGRIIEAPVFKERADRAHRVIYYDVGILELQIYHNQPVDERHIGYVDLEHQSVKEIEMTMDRGGLNLLFRNSTLVRIENWVNYEPARDMVFAFKDVFLPNARCIFSDCEPNDIVEEFMGKRERLATSGASRGSSWIDVIVNPFQNYYKFSTNFCITSNLNLILVLLQNVLNRRFPLPKPSTIPTVVTLANIINFINEHQGDSDPFQLYCHIADLVRNERFSIL